MQLIRNRSLTLWLFIVLIPATALLTGCPTTPTSGGVGRVPIPPLSAKGIRYTIDENDTFTSIARKHKIDWRDIMDANPMLLDPSKFKPGVVIVIPIDEPPPPVPIVNEPIAVTHNPGHSGPIPAEKAFIWPVKGTVLCKFSRPVPWRMKEFNNGIDIKATPTTIVRAAKSGRVNTFRTVPGFGQVVVLEHYDGMVTFYGHLGRILVTHGTWVKQGERIGIAGSSGLSSGVELHFRMLRAGRCIDPLPKLP